MGESWGFFLFVCLFLSRWLSLGTLVFVLGEHCGGGPWPPGDHRSSRWGPQLPPRRAAQGQPYLSISALQRHHELRMVLVRLLGQLKGFLDLQQFISGSHGRGAAAGSTPHSPARETTTAAASARAASNRAREQLPISRESRAGARSCPPFGGGAGAGPGRTMAGGQWRPMAGNARGAAPFLHNHRTDRVEKGSEVFESEL